MSRPRYLYHYTSKENAEQIEESKCIRMSRCSDRDAILGDGVYLTDLPPDTDNETLLENNYGHANQSLLYKIEVCFRFLADELSGYRCERRKNRVIYCYRNDIDLNQVSFELYTRNSDGSWTSWQKFAAGGLLAAGLLGAMALIGGLVSDKKRNSPQHQ